MMALPVRIKCGGAAATRKGQYKKRGRCRNEKWSEKKAGAKTQREIDRINREGEGERREVGDRQVPAACHKGHALQQQLWSLVVVLSTSWLL